MGKHERGGRVRALGATTRVNGDDSCVEEVKGGVRYAATRVSGAVAASQQWY